MDLTPFTGAATDVGVAIGVVGAAIVVAYSARKTFGFVTAAIGSLFGAGKGKAAG
jgi:hypothetical protein